MSSEEVEEILAQFRVQRLSDTFTRDLYFQREIINLLEKYLRSYLIVFKNASFQTENKMFHFWRKV